MSLLPSPAARGEWRRHWPAILGASAGYSCAGLPVFTLGAFVASLQAEFSWTRTQVLSGIAISSAAGTLLNIVGGWLLDRFGAVRVGLVGQVVVCTGFALLAGASGGTANWAWHWLIVACGIALVQPLVWTSIAAHRFDHGRGLAIAAILSGSSLTAAAVPVLATTLIARRGWRPAIAATSLIWLALTLAIVLTLLVLFRSAASRSAATARAIKPPSGVDFRDGLRRPALWVATGGMFSFLLFTTALAPNLIPLLMSKHLSLTAAGGIAALVGLAGLVARLGVGHLLDRLPSHLVAGAMFALPIGGMALMLIDAPAPWVLALSAMIFGATIGAENDVIIFLVARHLGMRSFGALLGLVSSVGAVAAVAGPVGAGWLYDRTGHYGAILTVLMVAMGASALAMIWLGEAPAPPADRASR